MKSRPTEAMGGRSALMYSVSRQRRLEAELRITFRSRPDPGSSPHKDQPATCIYSPLLLVSTYFLYSIFIVYFRASVETTGNVLENMLFYSAYPTSLLGLRICRRRVPECGRVWPPDPRATIGRASWEVGAMWRNLHSIAIQSMEYIRSGALDIVVTSQLWSLSSS